MLPIPARTDWLRITALTGALRCRWSCERKPASVNEPSSGSGPSRVRNESAWSDVRSTSLIRPNFRPSLKNSDLPPPNPTTRAIFRFGGGRSLFFNDGRKFGRIKLVDRTSLQADSFLTRLGPEPLDGSFTLAGFRSAIQRHRRAPVKAVILNQSVLAGIGNIYADE